MVVLQAIWRVVLLGLITGSLYAPVSAGLVILYRSSGVLNFAQGAFAFMGAYFFYLTGSTLGLPFIPAAILALIASGGCGVALHWLLVRPIIGQRPVVVVMVTIALGSVIEAVVFLVWGTTQRFLHHPFGSSSVRVPGNVTLSKLDIAIFVTVLVILVALALVLKYTRVGMSIRAVSDSPLLAGYYGRNSGRVIGLTWGISFALSSVAGIAYAVRSVLDSGVLDLGTLVFPAVIIGGMDSLAGAAIGSVVLGVVTSAASIYLGGQWSDFVVYIGLLVVLAIRPYGIFGTRELARL